MRMLTYDELQDWIIRLGNEVARLKAGKFTPEELQNLCHNLGEDDRDAFFAGCTEYQRKLFGCAQVDLKDK